MLNKPTRLKLQSYKQEIAAHAGHAHMLSYKFRLRFLKPTNFSKKNALITTIKELEVKSQ